MSALVGAHAEGLAEYDYTVPAYGVALAPAYAPAYGYTAGIAAPTAKVHAPVVSSPYTMVSKTVPVEPVIHRIAAPVIRQYATPAYGAPLATLRYDPGDRTAVAASLAAKVVAPVYGTPLAEKIPAPVYEAHLATPPVAKDAVPVYGAAIAAPAYGLGYGYGPALGAPVTKAAAPVYGVGYGKYK